MRSAWRISPKIKEDFIKKNPGHSRVVLQLLANRGVVDKKEIEKFLKPERKDILNPFLFNRMEEAVKLVIKHIREGNKIVVFGDYDADGVTASAVLVETLSVLKANVDVYLPERVSEGYGLNKKALKELVDDKVKLIVTVDNGIRNKEEVKYAKSLGLDVIITDHHEAPEEKNDLPDCLIINPKTEDYPFRNLAGAGVALKLAGALISKSKLTLEQKQRLGDSVLDLVSIGTIADCVSLLGENRVLVIEGLKILNQQKRLGLRELIKVSQANGTDRKKINSWNIGWQIAPRLNSAGRLSHANTAYKLLTTKDRSEALSIARALNNENAERQRITNEIFEYCQKFIEKEMADEKILILLSPNLTSERESDGWAEGVVGLVAGKLCEKYSRPVIVITKFGDEIRGSARSVEGFDIINAIEKTSEFLLKFGGHVRAAGFSLKNKASLEGFVKKIKKITEKELEGIDLNPKVAIEAEIDLRKIDENLVEELAKLEPFGEDNPRPKFVSYNLQILDKMIMGADGQHAKFRINGFWAVAFGQGEKWKSLRIGDKVDLVYFIEFNEFNGSKSIQLKVVDIKIN